MQNPIMMPNNHPVSIELTAVDHILKIIRQVPMPATESFPLIHHIETQRQVAVDQFIDAQGALPVVPIDHTKDLIDEICSRLMCSPDAALSEKDTVRQCVAVINATYREFTSPAPALPAT